MSHEDRQKDCVAQARGRGKAADKTGLDLASFLETSVPLSISLEQPPHCLCCLWFPLTSTLSRNDVAQVGLTRSVLRSTAVRGFPGPWIESGPRAAVRTPPLSPSAFPGRCPRACSLSPDALVFLFRPAHPSRSSRRPSSSPSPVGRPPLPSWVLTVSPVMGPHSSPCTCHRGQLWISDLSPLPPPAPGHTSVGDSVFVSSQHSRVMILVIDALAPQCDGVRRQGLWEALRP